MTLKATERQAIRRGSTVPAYYQLADILRQRITDLPDADRGKPLPSEGELARQYALSRITVRQALKSLEAKGLVYSIQGKGSFPTMPRVPGISGFHSFTSEVQRNGQQAGSRLLALDMAEALPAEIVDKLSVPAQEDGAQVHLRRVRLIDDTPIAIEDAWLPSGLFPDLDLADLGNSSLYAHLAEHWGLEPAWTDALIEPQLASPEIAALLEIAPGDPVLVAWRVTLTADDKVFERVRSIYRPGFALRVARYRLS